MLNPCISYLEKVPNDIKCGDYWQCEYCEHIIHKEGFVHCLNEYLGTT